MGRILAQSPESGGGMSGAGGERPLIRPNSANFGGRRGAKRTGGGLSPRTFQARRGAFFALFAGSGSPPPHWGGGRARPARRRKKPNRTAAHNSHSAPNSRGAGSPPSASARPAPRSPDSAQGANSPNAPARGGGKQSRPARQGKCFSARPSGFGGFGRMRRAGRARGRRRVRGGE